MIEILRAIMAWVMSWISKAEPVFHEPEDAPAGQKVSAAGISLIKHFEGLRLEAYTDPAGVLTIGYGDTTNVTRGMVITEDEAVERLTRRLATEFVPGVIAAIQRPMTQGQLDAMVSLVYNIGVGAFASSTLARKFNEGDVQGASSEFVRWKFAGGRELAGLRKRRAAERAVFDGKSLAVALRIADATP